MEPASSPGSADLEQRLAQLPSWQEFHDSLGERVLRYRRDGVERDTTVTAADSSRE